jgi:hypothetical protein
MTSPPSTRCLPELADSIDAVVGLPEFDQLRDQLLVPPGAGGGSAGLGGVVATRSHLQQPADELDSEPATIDPVVLVRVDERDYFR